MSDTALMGALGLLIAWLVVATSGAMATALWLRGLWQSRSALPVWIQALAGLGAASALCGAFGTLMGLRKAFGAVSGESVEPSQKARILGEGIAQAMNWTALAFLVGLPIAAALSVWLRARSKRAG